MPPSPLPFPKSAFARMAVLAWGKSAHRSIAAQMAEDIDRSEKICRKWLDADDPIPPPNWVVKRAYEAASQELDATADLLDRVAGAVHDLEDDTPPASV